MNAAAETSRFTGAPRMVYSQRAGSALTGCKPTTREFR
jgi:hypothetical protein